MPSATFGGGLAAVRGMAAAGQRGTAPATD